jgi:hypothetical protein
VARKAAASGDLQAFQAAGNAVQPLSNKAIADATAYGFKVCGQ